MTASHSFATIPNCACVHRASRAPQVESAEGRWEAGLSGMTLSAPIEKVPESAFSSWFHYLPINPTSARSQPIPSSGTVYRGFQARRHRTDRHRPSLPSCGAPPLRPQCDRSPCNARTGDLWRALLPAPSAIACRRTAGETGRPSFHDRIPSAPASCGGRICWHRPRSSSPGNCRDASEQKGSRRFPFLIEGRLGFPLPCAIIAAPDQRPAVLKNVSGAPAFLPVHLAPVPAGHP